MHSPYDQIVFAKNNWTKAMHNQESIQDILKNTLSSIHQKRVMSLIAMSSSLLNGGSLTVVR